MDENSIGESIMASIIDVIMAQHDRDVSEEELKTQKNIENDWKLRAIDDIGVMAEGATAGYQMGKGIDDARANFQRRSAAKAGYMSEWIKENPGATMKQAKKAWRKGGKGDFKEFMSNQSPLALESMNRSQIVSTYLEGVNLAEVKTDGKNVSIIDDKTKGRKSWLNIKGWFNNWGKGVHGQEQAGPTTSAAGAAGATAGVAGAAGANEEEEEQSLLDKALGWYPGKYIGEFWDANATE